MNSAVGARRFAAIIHDHFRAYNEEFGCITRRAARHFLSRDWESAQLDAVARIELYEERVARCVASIEAELLAHRTDVDLWHEIKNAYGALVARIPDGAFYGTFFNSVTRDLFGTVGVNEEVEFGAGAVVSASGIVPLRVYRVSGSLPAGVREILIDLPFGTSIADLDSAVHRISADIGRYLQLGRTGGNAESIEVIDSVFYRGTRAFAVGRLIGDGSIAPLIIAFTNGSKGVEVDAVLLSRADVGALFGYALSYFHADLPAVGAAITMLRSFMPRKSVDELYTVLGRAKQGKAERFFALQRHLNKSIDSFVRAPGERGLVMTVFTLPSHDLVFKVIRDRFGAPKTCTRADVIDRYQFVFRHDRAGRLVDAQEFKRLRLPRARFMSEVIEELVSEASETCRVDGDDLVIEQCYIERRLRPLNLFIREAEPAAAEAAVIEYGNALRDLAGSNVFPGDLLLKNFGVTSHGRVIFYDYDEICLVSQCNFRELPVARSDEEEMAAEPWFHCGPADVFPEQWLPFLGLPPALEKVFLKHHAQVLTAAWWRNLALGFQKQAAYPPMSMPRTAA